MTRFRNLILRAALVAGLVLPFAAPIETAHAAASAQITHAFMCATGAAAQGAAGRTIGGTNTNVPSATLYSLNGAGCALIQGQDIGYFLSQGYTYGPSTFVLQQTGITASTTSSTSTITLPPYAYIVGVVLTETAGNAITGGVDIGNATSATAYASAVTLGANADVAVVDSALTRVYPASGNPVAEQVLVACHSACNSGSINITILYTYY